MEKKKKIEKGPEDDVNLEINGRTWSNRPFL